MNIFMTSLNSAKPTRFVLAHLPGVIEDIPGVREHRGGTNGLRFHFQARRKALGPHCGVLVLLQPDQWYSYNHRQGSSSAAYFAMPSYRPRESAARLNVGIQFNRFNRRQFFRPPPRRGVQLRIIIEMIVRVHINSPKLTSTTWT